MAEVILSGVTLEQHENIVRSIVREELEYVLGNYFPVNQKTQIDSHSQNEKKYIYSIKELAKFLNCSPVTAQSLKNKGQIPCHQIGRKLMFDVDLVKEAMSKNGKGSIKK